MCGVEAQFAVSAGPKADLYIAGGYPEPCVPVRLPLSET